MNIYRVTGYTADDQAEIDRLVGADSLDEAQRASGFAEKATVGVEYIGRLYGTSAPELTRGGRYMSVEEIKASVSPDGKTLRSFEDGKPYRTLTLHLKARGMTPAQYRTKWGLPPEYPMNAPRYSMERSQAAIARAFWLKKGTETE